MDHSARDSKQPARVFPAPARIGTSHVHFSPRCAPTTQNTPETPSRHPLGHRNTPDSVERWDETPVAFPLPQRPVTPPSVARTPVKAPHSPKTPRKRKSAGSRRQEGIQSNLGRNLSITRIRERVKVGLKLEYDPDDWQIYTIQRILEGYDTMFCAGTGYGKSLVFEGLAYLGSKQNKVLIVICPLKALENDQAEQAAAKGLDAVAINEDTERSRALWARLRISASLVYMSPEMAQSPSFQKLWLDARFRTRLTALLVDEAHCIDEWGDDEFRPLYRKLSSLRVYTGTEIPFVACTATCQTSTFNTIWQTLAYGDRPFWGVDVGSDRKNLFFAVRQLEHPELPILNILGLLPSSITPETVLDAIAKCLFYFDTEAECRAAVYALRMLLPAHLRDCVQPFSSSLSEECKKALWEAFRAGTVRILCATDAAGMGCNVPDVRNVVVFGCPRSFASVAQRWGRAGRNRTVDGTCLLLVPPWAFNPSKPAQVVHTLGRGRAKKETKTDVLKREKLDPHLRAFINLNTADNSCQHKFLRDVFRPDTRLSTRTSLTGTTAEKIGARSHNSPFNLSWIQLDLGRNAPSSRCCSNCNPSLMAHLEAGTKRDPRLLAYANEFKYPLARAPTRSSSVSSARSEIVNAKPTKEEEESLRGLLIDWRKAQWVADGSSDLWSEEMSLPPKQLEGLVKACYRFHDQADISVSAIRRAVALDCLSDSDIQSISGVLDHWNTLWKHLATPRTERQRPRVEPSTPMAPLNWGASVRPTPPGPTDVFGMAVDADISQNRSPSPPLTPVEALPTTQSPTASPSRYYRDNTLDSSPSRVHTQPRPAGSSTLYYRPRTQQYHSTLNATPLPRTQPTPGTSSGQMRLTLGWSMADMSPWWRTMQPIPSRAGQAFSPANPSPLAYDPYAHLLPSRTSSSRQPSNINNTCSQPY